MADTTFTSGVTVVTADWLNDINDAVYAGSTGILQYFFGRHAAEFSASVTPSNYGYPPLDIRRYGGVGDDTTNCDAAFTAAIKVACYWFSDNLTAAAVYVPAGKFLVTMNNFIGQFDFTTFPGAFNARYRFSIRGDGWASQIHWRPTGSTAAWMYDNGSASSSNNRLVEPLFSNVRFTLDVTGLSAGGTVNGFRLFGSAGNATQGFKFDRCQFVGVDYPGSATDIAKAGTLIQLLGTVNASETALIGCRVRGMATLLNLGANAESVNHNLVNTDAEVMYGDIIKCSGGSSITWHGGSCSMMTETANSYFFAMRVTTAAFAGTHVFEGVRCEMNVSSGGVNYFSRLFLLDTAALGDPPSYFAKVSFHGCNFYPITGAARDTIVVDAASGVTVNFDGCDIFASHRLNALNSLAGLQTNFTGPFTAVNFRNGSAVLPANITFASTSSVVHVSARDCANTLDYDITANGRSENRFGRSMPLKTVMIYGVAWPDLGNNATMSLVLPPNCIIKAARFRKAANGGAATANYQLRIQDGNALAHTTSGVAAQNTLHTSVTDNIMAYASTTNERTISLVCTAGNLGSTQTVAMAASDYAAIDYY